MKKKTINHAIGIATENPKFTYQYTDGDRYFITDRHRIFEYDKAIETTPSVSVNAHANDIVETIKRYIDDDHDYILYELPTVAEIKANIAKVAGRRLVDVVWGNEKFNINARWLYKAMESLNAKVCYIDEYTPHKKGIVLYENDNLQSEVRELILPICKIDREKVWYWIK